MHLGKLKNIFVSRGMVRYFLLRKTLTMTGESTAQKRRIDGLVKIRTHSLAKTNITLSGHGEPTSRKATPVEVPVRHSLWRRRISNPCHAAHPQA